MKEQLKCHHLLMSTYSSSSQKTHGMVIFLSTYKPRGSHINIPMNKSIKFTTHWYIMSSLVIPYIIEALYSPSMFPISWRVGNFFNDCHSVPCGGHLSRLIATQKNCVMDTFGLQYLKIEVVKKCHPNQEFMKNMCVHLALLYTFIIVSPFAKSGIDFTTCNPTSDIGHK